MGRIETDARPTKERLESPLSKSSEKYYIYCNRCRGTTNHVLHGQYVNSWKFPDDGIQGQIEHSLWICAGCETGVLEVRESDSESFLDDGTPEYRREYFPKRMHESLTPKRFKKLGTTLEQIYKETIESLNAGSLILSTAGLRALLEGICEDKGISGRDLKTKIENLKPLLPNDNIIEAMHHFRFTGNDAVHKLKAPKVESVKLAISVMEDLLNFLYELDYKASMLTNKVSTDDDD